MGQIKTLYILIDSIPAASAVTNRLFAMVESFVKLDVDVHVISINDNNSDYAPRGNVKIISLANENLHIKRGDYYYQYFLSAYRLKRFLPNIPQFSKVLLIGCRNYLHILAKRNDLYLSQEVTEHISAIRTFRSSRYRKFCSRLNNIFVISTALRDDYMNNNIIPSKIHIINMFANPLRFDGLKKTKKEGFVITYCGNMGNKKDGIDILIKAFSIVSKKRQDVNLLMIGTNKGEYDSLVHCFNLEGKIMFIGSVSSGKVPQMLKNSDVLVLARPSSIQAKYGFPTKLGEYLLTRNPVLVTDTGDIGKFLQNNVSAYIVEPGNAQLLAASLVYIIDNYDEACNVGKRGCDVAILYFNSFSETKKMYNIIFDN